MSKKILIVDDDVDSLKLIGLMLRRQGYEVVVANAGNQALSHAVDQQPDLIILDVMMPDMNGYEVCRRLRGNSGTENIPIIMFTAKTLIDDKVAGFEAGADDYLTKPTHPAELASRVKAVLQRSEEKMASALTTKDDSGVAIGIIGAKGGIGTTTVTHNLGEIFQRMGENPIVADFRLGDGSLGLFMGVGQRSLSMAKVLTKPVQDVPYFVKNELFTHQSGLRMLLSSPDPKEALRHIQVDAAVTVISELRSLGRPAIFDLGSGYSNLINKLQQHMDKLIVLVEPSKSNLQIAQGLLHELEKEGRARVNVAIMNRNNVAMQLPWHEVEHTLGYEMSTIISSDPDQSFQAMESGVPLVTYYPDSVVASQLRKLAESLKITVQ
jgi:CheY-like chemotaxis protein